MTSPATSETATPRAKRSTGKFGAAMIVVASAASVAIVNAFMVMSVNSMIPEIKEDLTQSLQGQYEVVSLERTPVPFGSFPAYKGVANFDLVVRDKKGRARQAQVSRQVSGQRGADIRWLSPDWYAQDQNKGISR